MCEFCPASMSSVNECISKLENKLGTARRLSQIQIVNKFSTYVASLKSMKRKHSELEARIEAEKINHNSPAVASLIEDIRILGIDLASAVLKANCLM